MEIEIGRQCGEEKTQEGLIRTGRNICRAKIQTGKLKEKTAEAAFSFIS